MALEQKQNDNLCNGNGEEEEVVQDTILASVSDEKLAKESTGEQPSVEGDETEINPEDTQRKATTKIEVIEQEEEQEQQEQQDEGHEEGQLEVQKEDPEGEHEEEQKERQVEEQEEEQVTEDDGYDEK